MKKLLEEELNRLFKEKGFIVEISPSKYFNNIGKLIYIIELKLNEIEKNQIKKFILIEKRYENNFDILPELEDYEYIELGKSPQNFDSYDANEIKILAKNIYMRINLNN
ncbi:hypothetical protein SSYRP_v1c09850 [Spiroplasma syrphidicola EA-1]|uniref:Uncharacterized protein n=1 Tax=Spiroplasma syrphidicola EA-1 TaxID=1276229 RepID=R4U510_9MOLU|nr:hypothetical protein [Spiroplasma syrphidicola]AGM26572.1 hypothetical protein SSYRP_v1c09850 [Spiroplasma syrphidicola EA-1]